MLSPAFSFVQHVAELAPIFLAAPGGEEFRRPKGWQSTVRRPVEEALEGFQAGWALCAVTGEHLAVVDVDPQNGGDVEQVRALLASIDVRVYGEVATPGGGAHFYVAGHHTLESSRNLPGWPGVDWQSHDRNVFLPGTKRPKYGGAGYTVVFDHLGDLGGLDGFHHGWNLGNWVTNARGVTPAAVSVERQSVAVAGENPAYVQAAVDAEMGALSACRGNRNDQLNASAFSLFGFVKGDHLDRDSTWDTLRSVAVEIGLTPHEVDATLASAFAAAEPRQVPIVSELPALTVLGATGEAEFWCARPVLAHLHNFARSRRAGPWAVLGAALARVVVATPPMVMLPPLVGTEASLNLFVAIVGASGSGKGAATGAARDSMTLGQHLLSCSVGSGEGLTHLFVKREKGVVVQHTHAAIAEVAEVDTIAALSARQGATLQPVLRQAYMGEQFGFGYADPAKRLDVGAHAYRLALVVGVQPKRAGALLDDVDGGTPQRFLWMPADDAGAPDTAPETPRSWTWTAPALPPMSHDGRRRLPVCATARVAVDAGRLARVRGELAALDGHSLLTRLKVGAALGLLDGRAEVSEDDWALAGIVMAVSDGTRARVEGVLRLAKRSTNEARADAEGTRAVIVSELVDAAAVKTVAKRVRRLLAANAGVMTHAGLYRSLTRGHRDQLDDALTALLDAGHITVEETTQLPTGGGGPGRRYRSSTAGAS